MAKIPNINCKQYDKGQCNKKPSRFFGLFKADCCEAVGITCNIREKWPKPSAPPPPPLTEGKTRGGMRNTIGDGVKPMAPPPPGIAGRKEIRIRGIEYTIHSTRKTRKQR